MLEEQLGFPTYVKDVIKLLEEKNSSLEHYQIGENFSVILGDSISKVDAISYETPYSIIIKETSTEIPRSREYDPRYI